MLDNQNKSSMLECNYFKKSDLKGFKALVKQLEHYDIAKIAGKIGRTPYFVRKYSSTEERFANVRVPQAFIDAANEIIEERNLAVQEVNSKLKK